MNFLKWLFPIAGFFLIWKFVLPLVGLSPATAFLMSALFTVGVVSLIGKFFPMMRVPIPVLSNLKMLWILALIGVPLIVGGAFSIPKIFGGAVSAVAPAASVGVTADACKDSITNKEIIGKASTITLNAWDMENASPYTTAVDLTTSCWLYKNGEFKAVSADTSAGTVSNIFTVGDTITVYCGGTSYYSDVVSSQCIDSEAKSIDISTHTAMTITNLQTTCYDNTASATLTAGVSNLADYNLTLGAGSVETIYCKWKANQVDSAFNFAGVGVAKFFNISKVLVLDDDLGNTYTAAPTPLFLQSINVQMATSSQNTINKDYIPYLLSSPVLLTEWETVKVKIEVTANTDNNPRASTENTTSFNGFAVNAIDAATAVRATDGSIVQNTIHSQTSAQSNAGLTETLASPIGLTEGALISAN